MNFVLKRGDLMELKIRQLHLVFLDKVYEWSFILSILVGQAFGNFMVST